ncbi:hypothetical protein [Myroides sp. N17-2]|uniref:hypothetical protein n=1 Tax=Myroides sp. N17-2 TaxID=2030799 RepID=UPI0011816B98|nr:hypothetical protein [Myroides sp. N17-2]
MNKCLIFMLVITLVSCTKEVITPVPDTAIEGIRNVKTIVIESYNLEFDSYDRTTEHFDKDGFLTREEYAIGVVIDDEASDEYFIEYRVHDVINYTPYNAKGMRRGECINEFDVIEYSIVRSWTKQNEYKDVINYTNTSEYITTVKGTLDEKRILMATEEKKASTTVPRLISMQYVSYTFDDKGYVTPASVTYKSEKDDKNAVTYKIEKGKRDSHNNVLERTFIDTKGEIVKENTYTYEYY